MRTRIKICGVRSADDARAAVDAGADAIGLNFYPKSPRFIDEPRALEILDILPDSVDAIVLSVDEPWDAALARLRRLRRATAIQMHSAAMSPCPDPAIDWVPAFAIRDASSVETIRRFLEGCDRNRPRSILVDAHVPGQFGGTGQVLPWTLLDRFDAGVRLILAGGLTPENVAAAVAAVGPWMVDVASGVESSPGRKDPEKMRRFIQAAHEGEASRGASAAG